MSRPLMRRWLAALDRHWFAPASLRDLALVRIIAFGSQTLVFLLLPDGRLRSLSSQLRQTSDSDALYDPVAVLQLLLLPFGQLGSTPPSPTFLTVVFGVAIVSGILATIGLYACVSMLLAAASNALLIAHHFSYGEFHHAEALMIIALGVLALGPSAEAWSVDARRRQRRTGMLPPERSEYARWPLRLIQWAMVLTYVSAAWSKLSIGGLAWFNGYTMAYHYLVLAMNTGREAPTFMASLPPQAHIAIALFGWLVEAGFVLAILVPRTAWLFVLAGIGLHMGVYATMGIAFFQTIVLYCVFIEPLRLHWPRSLRPRARRVQPFATEGTGAA